MKSDIKPYIGFSIKKGSVVYGLEGLEKFKRKIYLVLICCTAQQKTNQKVKELTTKKGIPLIVSTVPLNEITGKTNVKLIGLTDENLANAVLKNFSD